jgi:hypothetical protein
MDEADLLPGREMPSFQHTDIDHRFDSRFTLLRNGIRRASGKWIYVLDYDDCVRPDGLMQLWAAGEESGADLVIANANLVQDGPDGQFHSPYRSETLSIQSLVRRNQVPFNAILVRRETAVKAISRSPALSLYEDYGFLLTLLSMGPPCILPPEIMVADYHVNVDQNAKYANVNVFSSAVIDKFRETTVFPIPGAELMRDYHSAVREKADAGILASLPELDFKTSPLRGHCETVRTNGRVCQVEGWCYDTQAPAAPVWGIYAVLSKDRAILMDNRITRADVSTATRQNASFQGFSGMLLDAEDAVVMWVVWNGYKLRLPTF